MRLALITLSALSALLLTACGGGGMEPAPEPAKLAPATPVVCQIVINGVPQSC